MSSPAKKLHTYEDILRLPPNLRGEIIFGELLASPRPSPAHQKAMAKMTSRLDGKLGEASGGRKGEWLFLTEPELHLASHIVVPDIAAWRINRVSSDFYSKAWISVIPDWVCEIQSPSTARIDRVTKRRVYLELKVPYYWLLDPIAKTLETMKFNGENWLSTGSFGGDDLVRVEPFLELEMDLSLFWVPGLDT